MYSRVCVLISVMLKKIKIPMHIFSLIQRHLGLTHPVKRLWISDLTTETIRTGFETLKDGSEYENLTRAARSRSEADLLIGMNGSRAFVTEQNIPMVRLSKAVFF
jgi:DNA topoisomerase-3